MPTQFNTVTTTRYLLFIIGLLFISSPLKAQTKNIEVAGDWLIGAGINVVGDGGNKDVHTILNKDSKHFSHPYLFTVEYMQNKRFSFLVSASFNSFKVGKKTDNYVLQGKKASNYFAVDIASKLYIRNILNSYIIEPYLFAGLGYTTIESFSIKPLDTAIPAIVKVDEKGLWVVPEIGRITVNTGMGLNYWISNFVGLQGNVAAKWSLAAKKDKQFASNQLQFSLGGFYSFHKNK